MREKEIDTLFTDDRVVDIEIRNKIKHHIGIDLGHIIKPVGEVGSEVRVLGHWNWSKRKFKEILEGNNPLLGFTLSGAVELLAVTDFYSQAVNVGDLQNKEIAVPSYSLPPAPHEKVIPNEPNPFENGDISITKNNAIEPPIEAPAQAKSKKKNTKALADSVKDSEIPSNPIG